jgi:hypothetical protein
MPNHPNGFAPDTYVCVGCYRPDGQTMVDEDVTCGYLSECSARDLWTPLLAAELMKCRSFRVGTFEQ